MHLRVAAVGDDLKPHATRGSLEACSPSRTTLKRFSIGDCAVAQLELLADETGGDAVGQHPGQDRRA